MIAVSTFNLLVSMAILMFLYSVIDHENRLYANIVISFASAIMLGWLGEAVSIGAMEYTSRATGDILKFIGFIAFVYCGFMIYEVIDIAFQEKTELTRRKENGEALEARQ